MTAAFDPPHVTELQVEYASNRPIPADWPCQIVRRAAALMKERADEATLSATGRWIIRGDGNSYPQSMADSASAVIVADAFEAPGVNRIAAHVTALDPTTARAVADAWAQQADDMSDHLAHLHAGAYLLPDAPGWCVADEDERVHEDWTATVKAALAYLREDAPKAVRSDG